MNYLNSKKKNFKAGTKSYKLGKIVHYNFWHAFNWQSFNKRDQGVLKAMGNTLPLKKLCPLRAKSAIYLPIWKAITGD